MFNIKRHLTGEFEKKYIGTCQLLRSRPAYHRRSTIHRIVHLHRLSQPLLVSKYTLSSSRPTLAPSASTSGTPPDRRSLVVSATATTFRASVVLSCLMSPRESHTRMFRIGTVTSSECARTSP